MNKLCEQTDLYKLLKTLNTVLLTVSFTMLFVYIKQPCSPKFSSTLLITMIVFFLHDYNSHVSRATSAVALSARGLCSEPVCWMLRQITDKMPAVIEHKTGSRGLFPFKIKAYRLACEHLTLAFWE